MIVFLYSKRIHIFTNYWLAFSFFFFRTFSSTSNPKNIEITNQELFFRFSQYTYLFHFSLSLSLLYCEMYIIYIYTNRCFQDGKKKTISISTFFFLYVVHLPVKFYSISSFLIMLVFRYKYV